MQRTSRVAAIVAMGLAGALASAPAGAEVDFSGQRIEQLVPYSAGGGADLYSRFWGPLIAKHLPGEPTLIIKNVPGAGAIAGSNQFQDRAEPDGTDLITASASVMLNFAFRDERGHYRLDEWIPILSSPSGTVVYAHSSLGIEGPSEITKLADQEVRLGANNPTGGDLRVLLAMDLLGVGVTPVFGMNRGDVYPSFQRGELNLDFSATNAYEENIVPLVEAGEAVPLFTLGYTNDEGEIVRDPTQPDLPHFLELYEQVHGKPLEGTAREAWDAIYNLNVMSTRAILLPAGTPEEIVDTYTQAVRDALAEIQSDPELKQAAAEILGPNEQTTGQAAVRNVRSAVKFDDEAFQWLRNWVKQEFDADL